MTETNKRKKDAKGTIVRFSPDLSVGLSPEQVNERRAQGATNVKGKQYSKSTYYIIATNLFTFFNFLCVICVIALLFVKASVFNYFFAITYVFNLVIGIVQEIKAKNAIEKLSIMNEPRATALRGGKLVDIAVTDIVLDDIVKFSAGNQISADCTVLEGMVEVNESMLTGESVHVRKNKGDALFAGSYVVSGSAFAVVDKVGEDRYIQVLSAKAKKFKKPSSELLRSLQLIIKTIGIIIIPVGLGVLWTNYRFTISENLPQFVQAGALTETGIREIVTRSTSVVIGMIPAGMFLLTTLALAVGVIRLSQMKTSVQDMYSLEMLARVNVLCLDKTGTITDGKMQVENCIPLDEDQKYPIDDVISSMQNALPDNNQTALALKDRFGHTKKYIVTCMIPFSSDRKYSAVTFAFGDGNTGTFAVGAPEFVMKKNIPPQTASLIEHYTSLGQRVLLAAFSPDQITGDQLPADIRPYAIITLTDNIRRNVVDTIAWFRNNGVQIKVISGDAPATVSEVAKRAGIEGAEKYISLDGLSDSEVVAAACKYNVFGRVSPEQKALLVSSLKSSGNTVAMTGDGVNDILAMKESDCSVTVASGSDATKNIAHIVLMDNNFNSLPSVVGEGRRVINNIERSSSLYLMKTLFTLIFALVSISRGVVFPFNNQMMVMLEVVVIGIGSFALSMQRNSNKVDGKFLTYVFTHAIPGALVLILNVLVFDLMNKSTIISMENDYKDTIMVAALAFGGLAYLGVICRPYNLFRTILVLSLTAFSVVWICFFMPAFRLPNLFDDFGKNRHVILILVCLIQFDVTLAKAATSLFEFITHAKKA